MSLPVSIDSWFEPSDAQIADAKSQGITAWLGYFSNGSDRVYHGWADDTFRRILAAGLQTAAFCSGYADPAWIRGRAAALSIRAILDVESSIRADGPWVDPWLATSGAGLYGSGGDVVAHLGHGHACYVVAAYPGGDPGSYWPKDMAQPSQPHGWQYGGSNTFSFGTVDIAHYSPGLLTGTTGDEPLNLFQKRALCFPMRILTAGTWPEDQPTLDYYAARVADDGSNIEDIFGEMLADAHKGGRVPLEERPVAGPQGPKGDTGPQGPPGPAGTGATAHTHPFSGTTG